VVLRGSIAEDAIRDARHNPVADEVDITYLNLLFCAATENIQIHFAGGGPTRRNLIREPLRNMAVREE
jgi:hypothetical protein